MELWRSIRILHGELGDPFRIMPMTSAASSLSDGLYCAREEFNEQMGPYGVSRRYWTVPCELTYDEIGIIIGNSFILSQVGISQAISIFTKIRVSCSDINRFPKSKSGVVRLASKQIADNEISEIEAIDAIANYFKHHHEWPDDWDENQAKGVQRNTIQTIKKLGFSERELTDNMLLALSLLNIHDDDLCKLCIIVGDWRERLAKEFYKDTFVAECLPLPIEPVTVTIEISD